MKQPLFQFYVFPGSILASLIASHVAIAQILPDNTLPNNSQVSSQGNLIEINQGTRLGNQLFHSFEQFSVPEGNIAFFNNALDIQNIFSRVTGGVISNIDGIIEANGSANLFLINPNGIIFGSNASLNIGGSFISSTAERIIFADGSEFSATTPQSQALLTITAPIGLGLGSTPGTIINRSFATDASGQFFVGLEVPVGKTLALIGGDVSIEGGILTASEGRVELGSVAGNQIVNLTPIESGWQFGYEEIQAFQDINLSDFAFIETSGDHGGRIQIQGRQINFSDDTSVISATLGTGVGENIAIIASESIDLTGDATRIATESVDTGTAGNLVIETGKLTIRDGAFIETLNFSESSSGNITVKASESVELLDTTTDGVFSSGLFATVFDNASGEGKAITVETEKLIIKDGAAIFATTFGTGQAVDIIIKASESVELLGSSVNGRLPSGLFAQIRQGAIGDGGTLTIETQNLLVKNGATVSTSTFGVGKAGNLNVNALESIELIGTEPNNNISSGLFAQVEAGAIGDGGTLNIETAQLLIKDGAQVSTITFGEGKAGELIVNVSDSIEIIGKAANNLFSSGLFAQVEAGATNNGGALTIETNKLVVLAGAQISTTARQGAGGNLTVNATDSILLSGTAPSGDAFSSSGIFVSAEPGATSNAGELNLTTKVLTVEQGAKISADNVGTGEGNTATLNVERLIIQDGAQIGAGSLLGPNPVDNQRGSGGILTVNASESVEIMGSRQIGPNLVNSRLFTLAEGTGNAGDLNIFTPNLTVGSGGEINVSTLSSGAGGTLKINGERLWVQDNGIVSASTSTTGEAGSIEVTGNNLELTSGGRFLSTTAGEANAGNINVTVLDELTLTGTESGFFANTEANSTGKGGNINIIVEPISTKIVITDNAQMAVDSQGSGEGGTVELQAKFLNLDRGIITAETGSNQGGNIDLTVENLLQLSNKSQITATAGTQGAGGDGGNIDINAEFIISQPNGNQITANAFEGNGGNIDITTNNIFGAGFVDISASSEFGLDGTISISNPDVDPSQGLVELSADVIDAASLVAQNLCQQGKRSEFIVTGRGGVPVSPYENLTPTASWEDWYILEDSEIEDEPQSVIQKPLSVTSTTSSEKSPILEAQGWIIGSNGKTILTAKPVNVTPQEIWLPRVDCQQRRNRN